MATYKITDQEDGENAIVVDDLREGLMSLFAHGVILEEVDRIIDDLVRKDARHEYIGEEEAYLAVKVERI
jgi:hypothetical protein